MIYEILNDKDDVINRIVAEQWFVEKYYPGRYRLEPEPEPELDSDIEENT